MNTLKICSIEGCENPFKARGWCSKHYKAWKKHGDPLTTLRPGYSVNNNGYRVVWDNVNKTFIPEHRIIVANHLGRPLEPGETVHHINGNRQDNRIENLQLRQGQHGNGVIMKCQECGSLNIKSVALDDPNELQKLGLILLRIESDVKLDFQDVLLKPKRSTIKSRKEIQLERTFRFRYAEAEWTGVPVISSNMASVTTTEVAIEMNKRGMLSCIPKSVDFEIEGANFIPSFGLEGFKGYSFVKPTFLCLDVPNGYIEEVVTMVKHLRDGFDGVIIAGNVVTAEMTEALILAGADIVKVGIGSGAACSTRIKTGVGMPQLSAVMECADAAHGLSGHVISDGGCTTTGDIVKAFAAGADFVMLGGMLAGHDENGQDFYGSSSERGNAELSGGLKDYRAAEGWEIKLPARGPIARTLQDIEGGLRSACAYVGARNIKALPKCTTFVMVNRQANTSMWENRV